MTNQNSSYEGFNDYNPILDTDSLKRDTQLQEAVLKTSHGRRTMPIGKLQTTTTQNSGFFTKMKNVFNRSNNSANQVGTASHTVQREQTNPMPSSPMKRPATGQKRPLTGVQGAGFGTGVGAFGSFTSKSGRNVFENKEESDEERARRTEKEIINLITESCFACQTNNLKLALEKAEEALKLDKNLNQYRFDKNLNESDVNLSGFVCTELAIFILLTINYQRIIPIDSILDRIEKQVNLHCANIFTKCGMNTEAMNRYNTIITKKLLPIHNRVRINIGNILLRSKQYVKALKMYRIALDQISEQNTELKLKVRENIAIAYISMGQYADGAQTYQAIVNERPNYRRCFNLLVCYHTLGKHDETKQVFCELLNIPFSNFDDEYTFDKENKQIHLFHEAIRVDYLKQNQRKRQRFIEYVIITSAKIIGSSSDEDFIKSYEWCIEQVRNSTYIDLTSVLEIQKAIVYLRDNHFSKAISILKQFEKAETKLVNAVATNLSFLYFLEKDLNNAHKYADLALKSDKFNPKSLINKGNCHFAEQDYDKARYYYEQALSIDVGSIDALHNLILTLIKLKQYERAKDYLHKYAMIQPDNAQVFCLMGQVLEKMNDFNHAKSWYLQALSIHRTDGNLQTRLGELIDNQGNKAEALQYYFDAFRYNPCDISTLEWLGSYYVETQYPEKAVEFCAQAALVKPNQIKWHLMVASCYRRSGDYTSAFEKYKWIHQHFPDDTDCIEFLVKISTDLGLSDREIYENKLTNANKMKEIQYQRKTSADKSQNVVKGRKISSAQRDDSPNIPIQTTTNHRKIRNIDLNNTEGVFSQQEPVKIHPYVDQLPQHMTNERPKTAISKRGSNRTIFDDNDDTAELLPD